MTLNKRYYCFSALLMYPVLAYSGAVDTLLETYREQGAATFSAVEGESRWKRATADNSGRSCSDCHGLDLGREGRHATTGKRIEPMAPSVNPERLADAAKIEKWFTRNCKWTFGRACSPQEKGDFLTFLRQR